MKEFFKQSGIEIDNLKIEKLRAYSEFLKDYNKKVNLTRITEDNDIIIKHFIDSVIVLNYIDIPQGAKLVDVGTGAGFPGVPLKIFRPDIEITLVDSLNKRIVFLEQLLKLLEIEGDCVHSRGEDLSKNSEYSGQFDIATARAVAKIPDLKKYTMGFLKTGGRLLAYKDLKEEITEGNSYIYKLPNGDDRRLIEITK
ncbi:MAG: 16S rRNA (guanine(527)-N(7))-methyltransferase RsmG [Oscillospiraceae bacterium]|jgi:16S rRNA (guanine527-N7)-methyltransferase|nr:16S rRNA (guanine(527)-N(7))-methyltransferase RsmG [Oscillospiraceae bacterium]